MCWGTAVNWTSRGWEGKSKEEAFALPASSSPQKWIVGQNFYLFVLNSNIIGLYEDAEV